MESAAVVLNPHAGPPRRRLGPDAARALLRRHGFDVEVLLTAGPGEATGLAARAAERHPVVAAVGGDGTCHEVAAGLLGGEAALALLPCGSGNDFAAGLGIRTAAEGAAAAGRRAPRAVDVGWLGERPFFNSAGLFLSGEVSRRAAGLPRPTGRLRYLLGALAAMLAHRHVAAAWRLDGEAAAREGLWTLAEVGNGPLCGGGYRLTPQADPADGLLDFCLVGPLSLAAMARLLPAARRGGHLRDPRVAVPRAAGARLELAEAVWIHLDGEPLRLAAGTHDLRLSPGRLRVLAAAGEPARAREARA